MAEEVKIRLKKIVADHLGIEEEKVTEEASLSMTLEPTV